MFKQIALRQGHEFTPADGSRNTNLDLPRYIVWQQLAGIVRSAAARFAEWRRMRLCERELQHLDDRLLKDIGITRQSIHSVVRCGRGF